MKALQPTVTCQYRIFPSIARQEDSLKLGTGLLSLIATRLAALETFLSFSDLQTQHKRAAAGYSIARREIESFVMKYPDITGGCRRKRFFEFDGIKKLLDDFDKATDDPGFCL